MERKKRDFLYRISMKYLAIGCCCHVTKTMEKRRENESILHLDFIFMLMQLCVLWSMCCHMAIFFSSSYSQRPFEYLSLNLINLISAACISSISSYWIAMSNWFPNKSALRKKYSPKTKERKREKIEDIEFRVFESHTKININFQSRCVFFNGSGCFCCLECKSHFQFTNKLN